MKFYLKSIERTALFKSSSKTNFEQTGWGLTVKLVQKDGDRESGKLEMLVSDPAQIKMYNDAVPGVAFEVHVAPVYLKIG